LARKEENWLSSVPVLYCDNSGLTRELNELVVVATDFAVEARIILLEGVIPDLVQKTWVAGRVKEDGFSIYDWWKPVVWVVFQPHDLHIILHLPLCFPTPPKVATDAVVALLSLFHFPRV
jgi:hypothetical protein